MSEKQARQLVDSLTREEKETLYALICAMRKKDA
mgnify:FL=1